MQVEQSEKGCAWVSSAQHKPLPSEWVDLVALHSQMAIAAPPLLFINVYPFPAWIGVMLLGFGASRIFEVIRYSTLDCGATMAFVPV